MGIYKTVDVDVEVNVELEDVIDFIFEASDYELEKIKEACEDNSPIHPYIANTVKYEFAYNAFINAVNRSVDLSTIETILNSLK